MPLHDWTQFDAGIFHDFHQGWTVEIKRALNSGVLPDGYYALVEMPTATTESEIYDFVFGAARLDERGYPIHVTPEDERQIYVAKKNIIGVHRPFDDAVVAKVEVVAPGNKSTDDASRCLIDHITCMLRQGIHLLLIDILPRGIEEQTTLYNTILSELGRDLIPAAKLGSCVAVSFVADLSTTRAEALAIGNSFPPMPLYVSRDQHVEVPLDTTYARSVSGIARHLRRRLDNSIVPR